jgi:hypothetical protein
MDEAGVWGLKERVEEAWRTGYLPLDVGKALREAESLLRKYKKLQSFIRVAMQPS